eukprot:9492569-Pyramimonas_sp.AAC.1
MRFAAFYCALIDEGISPVGSDHGVAVFLAKGSDPNGASLSVSRKPETTWLIGLSNSDSKFISFAINRSLSAVAAQTVLGNHRACIAGRYMNENGIVSGSWAVSCFALCGHTHAGMIYKDIPPNIILAMRKLCYDVKVSINVGGLRSASLLAPRGFAQGARSL